MFYNSIREKERIINLAFVQKSCYDRNIQEWLWKRRMENTMEAYRSFAQVYDIFMDNIPYKEWCNYVIGILKEYGIIEGLIVELGCGTGNITEYLAKEGYDMIGIDNSMDMLEVAAEKREKSGLDILYLLQDMKEFELYGTVRAAISICDSMNYILEYQDLVKVFSLVNNYLDPGGIFIFDCNTEYKYQELLADNVIAENREEGSFIWENFYDKEECINEYDLTLFIPEGKQYTKYVETHYQRCYTIEELKAAIKEAGMELLHIYHAFTKEPLKEDSERVYIVAKECGKKKGEKEDDNR